MRLAQTILHMYKQKYIFVHTHKVKATTTSLDSFVFTPKIALLNTNMYSNFLFLEGTGLETVTSFLSVDLLVGKIPNLSGASLTHFGGKFGQFFRRTSFSATSPHRDDIDIDIDSDKSDNNESDRCASPAEEAIPGETLKSLICSLTTSQMTSHKCANRHLSETMIEG